MSCRRACSLEWTPSQVLTAQAPPRSLVLVLVATLRALLKTSAPEAVNGGVVRIGSGPSESTGLDITERSAQGIVADLVDAGYVVKERGGAP